MKRNERMLMEDKTVEIFLEILKEQDAEALFQFECSNRTFFEQSVPSRGEAYYQYENFLQSLGQLLDEHKAGISYFHLLKNEAGTIVGRMNLVDIDREKGEAQIGYRVGEACIGKGVATRGLDLLIKKAVRDYGVSRLYAKTTTTNIGSQKVLEKNGFLLQSIESKGIRINGEEQDFHHYLWSPS